MSKTLYFDWSMRTGVYTLIDWSQDVIVYPTLETAIKFLDPGDTLIGEATFESFNLTQRYSMIELARSRGITFLTTPTRLTGKTRRRLGYEGKSDEIDVFVVREVAQDPANLKVPAKPDPESMARRMSANDKLMDLRRSGVLTEKKRTPGRFTFTSDKDRFADQLIAQLPPFETLDEVKRKALGNGKGYSLIVVAAVGVAAAEARTTREFDHLTGLYAHAYPSQIRADLHHWAWAGGNTRAKLVQTTGPDGKRMITSKRVDGLTWTDFRRECRWLYHMLREVVQ